MKRSDVDAIKAACEAFSASHHANNGAPHWPGTKHMEAAIDAYNRRMGQGSANLEQLRADWREEMNREYTKLVAAKNAAANEPASRQADYLQRIAVALEQINRYGIKADS